MDLQSIVNLKDNEISWLKNKCEHYSLAVSVPGPSVAASSVSVSAPASSGFVSSVLASVPLTLSSSSLVVASLRVGPSLWNHLRIC